MTGAMPWDLHRGRALALTMGLMVVIANLLGIGASARAETRTVENTSDSGAGSLRTVIETAGAGDTIVFEGLSGETINLTSGAIGIDKNLTITGPGASQLTVDAGHNSQIFTISEGNVSISGLTLASGVALETGGAIEDTGPGSLTISDSTFDGNEAGGDGGSGDLSGQGHGGAIYVSPSASSLSVHGSTFTGNASGGDGGDGSASGRGRGGAIDYSGNGSLTVTDSTFSDNATGGAGGSEINSGLGRGGAIYVAEFAASTAVSGSIFTGNTAGGDGGGGSFSGRGEGGAIKGDSGTGPLTVSGSTFTGNTAGGQEGGGGGSGAASGGAINSFSSLTVTDSTFAANAAGGQGEGGTGGAFGFGGAITNFNNVSPLTVTGSTFTGNTAGGDGGTGNGGAINASGVSPRSAFITNSTFVGNTAGGGGAIGRGGAIEVTDMYSVTLASVTIDANTVGEGGTGAGINSATAAISQAAAVTAKATIVSGNTGATNCDAPVVSSSYSLEGPSAGDTSCGFDLPSADPQLEPLADNGGPTETQALPESSPAVDAVPAAKCPTSVDQRGEPRPDNGKAVCDAGAFELQDPPVAPTITSGATATFQVGTAGSFIVEATGLPTPSLADEGTLPSGVSFTDNGDGTASLAGAPAMGTGGSYPLTIKAANGAPPDAAQSFTLTVQAPPTVSISAPTDGAIFLLGRSLKSSFDCTDGVGGPGIASCTDMDGRGPGTAIDTATPGRHTFTVTAISGDGLTASASVEYIVAVPRPVPPLRVSIRSGRVLVFHRRAGIPLSCRGVGVDRVCRGTLKLTIPRRFLPGRHHRRRLASGEIVLARAGYALASPQRKTIVLRLGGRALRLLKHARRHRLRAKLTATLNGGHATHRGIVLKLKRRRH